jgi:hypothetical protein
VNETNRLAVLNQINQCDPIVTVGRVKNGHTWLFRFRQSESTQALREVGHVAADPSNEFTWYDAALVSRTIREGVFAKDETR